MSDFKEATRPAIENATKWANESAQLWLDTWVDMVDRVADGSAKPAKDVPRDLSKLALAGQRDAARVVNTWISLGTALVNLDLE